MISQVTRSGRGYLNRTSMETKDGERFSEHLIMT
jgi:hypothetical protein